MEPHTQGTLDDPSTLDAKDVARLCGADPENGLSGSEAARRLARDGANELRATPPTPRWRLILAQFRDPLIYLLLAAIVVRDVWLEPPVPTVNCRMPRIGSKIASGVCGAKRS